VLYLVCILSNETCRGTEGRSAFYHRKFVHACNIWLQNAEVYNDEKMIEQKVLVYHGISCRLGIGSTFADDRDMKFVNALQHSDWLFICSASYWLALVSVQLSTDILV
jgi:hypothetical protein